MSRVHVCTTYVWYDKVLLNVQEAVDADGSKLGELLAQHVQALLKKLAYRVALPDLWRTKPCYWSIYLFRSVPTDQQRLRVMS
jgi:hypothetical protein